MRLKSLLVLAIVTGISFANADTINWEIEEQSNIEMQNLYDKQNMLALKADMLINEAIEVGNEALASLQANMLFFKRIESDVAFRNCVVIKANIATINSSKKSAKELLDSKEVTNSQYQRYIAKLNGAKETLDKALSTKCK